MYRNFHALALALALALAMVAGSAHASSGSTVLDVKGQASFQQQRVQIEKDFASGNYSELASEDRLKVNAALDRISSSVQGVDDVRQLSTQKSTEVFNDQELVNELLTQAAVDSRLVCKREAKIGSNMKTTTCLTAAERRRQKEDAASQFTENRPNRGQVELLN
ncbi:hypothetical protein [Pseudoxanthomonas dokdonensis]|uniref:Secreted protein n=1 Tax=Pseudoxanthomonas dokdonensis TaxID=344882 RepID=A0A0R0CL40_9GAMM|nr:hypothetical protein [Pseudoxanthomonas dokdonensis]KRG70102.1 hypothetical protein ABB29_07715 [Pseudoxanthomonas dokdonensis]